VGFRDVLFLTAGLRAEANTGFGDSLGTPVAPRVGLSYVQGVGRATLKLRGSWGRAIRAPDPNLKETAPSGGTLRLANPTLRPERQRGWDAGIDAVFGTRGSVSVTYFNQVAEDLIQFVQLPSDSIPTFQYQNVGRVKNTGVEIEGTLALGPVNVRGQYGYARARIEDLGPNYTGDLRVADQTLDTPHHTAGVSLSTTPVRGTTIAAGLTYVGSWDDYDYFAMFSCFGGTGPCRATSRDYLIAYPGFAKVNASVFQQLTPFLSGFVSVDNLTNNDAFEYNDLYPVMGRATSVGLRIQY
jgi:outer membrane receptor protein involved in Fe transport